MNHTYVSVALTIIEDYIYDLLEPRCNWKKEHFNQQSYSRWGAEELYKYVREHKNDHPVDTVTAFAKKMDEYACMNSKNSYIFSVARDTAIDILDILIVAL